jgi:AraC family ethanolamine operon transcriptional activator
MKLEKENGVRVVDQHFFDIDRQAECLSGYDQSYQQISCGKFSGQFKTAILDPKTGLYFEEVNQVLDQYGSVPKDSYSVIFLMNRNLSCKLNGQPFSPNNLWVGGPGSTFNTLSVPGTHFGVIDFDRQFFEDTFNCYYPKVDNTPITGAFGMLYSDRNTSERLSHTIGEVLSILQNWTPLSGSSAIQSIRKDLAEIISNSLFHLTYSSFSHKTKSSSNYFKIWKKARDFINENKAIDISVTDLCHNTNVSRRTLEYSFRYSLGKSPAAYLRSIKLNEIRRAFLLPENAEKPIGDIVADWGIWHLSRFAQYYKQQFNELPSETRKFWRRQ